MPSARKARSCLGLTISELSTLTRPVTFLAMTEGRPLVVKCFLQFISLFYIVQQEKNEKTQNDNTIYKMTEYTLIRTRIVNGSPSFQVSKEGLKFLRQFRHQKLRIIFNITHRHQSLNPFCHKFLNDQQIFDDGERMEEYSQLRISEVNRELNKNCVLICLNAYENVKNAENSINFVILGYLIASVFFYHTDQPLGQDSTLSMMLRAMNKFLIDTNISKLQEQIKYKSGFNKKPYFMCLFYEQFALDMKAYFNEYYRYKQKNEKINESVDTLTDYFPQHSATYFTQTKVNQLSAQFMNNVLGRQILNFQITAHTIQNLCFQLCEAYNTKVKRLNLIQLYNKIIIKQKSSVKDRSLKLYTQLVKNLEKQLPKSEEELKSQHQKIKLHLIQESLKDASNCMDINQFQPILLDLFPIFNKHERKLQETNTKLMKTKITNLYETISDGYDSKLVINQMQQVQPTFEIVKDKIQLFVDGTIEHYTTKDLLMKIVSEGMISLSQCVENTMNDYDRRQEEYKQQIERLERQVRLLEGKNRQLQDQYSYTLLINSQFKLKLQDKMSGNSQIDVNGHCSSEVLALKKKIFNLEEQIEDQNMKIEDLTTILQKYDNEIEKKNSCKFTKSAQNLLSEIKNKINSFYPMFEELKKVQNVYTNISRQFQEKKKSFNEERTKEKKEKEETTERLNQIVKEKKQLEIIVEEGRKLTEQTQTAYKLSKQAVNQLQNQYAVLNGNIADTEELLQNYKKSLSLIGDCLNSKKFEKLRNFARVVEDEELQTLLEEVIKAILR